MVKKLNIPPKHKTLISSADKLRNIFSPLIGSPFKLSGKPRTDGSRLRKVISETLEQANLPELAQEDEFIIVPFKKKGVPRILTELIDTYLVTTGDAYNLQVWNRIPNSGSILVQYTKTHETICNKDVRYVLVKIENDKINSIVILSSDYIEKRFGVFGKPTIKHQLLVSDINRNKIVQSKNKINFSPDTLNVTSFCTTIYTKPDSNIGDKPVASKIFSLDLILERVAKPLIGVKIDAKDTKTRGQILERLVADLLGYETHQGLVGGYPDLPNQLLEVKVQDAQTIDLGKYTPEVEEIVFEKLGITTFDVRYLIALTNAKTNVIEGIILMPSKELGKCYTYVSDTSFKCQRSIPMKFFDSIKGACVVNPEY